MLKQFLRPIRRFFRRSRTINNEPLNEISLVIIILIDLFILANVFMGLNDIGYWYISPSQAYQCYDQWQDFLDSDADLKNYTVLDKGIKYQQTLGDSLHKTYDQFETDHLGQVSAICKQYANYHDALNTPENEESVRQVEQSQAQIDELGAENSTIRAQYDSTLLEEIAGQPREQSINTVEAAQAKDTLERNQQTIAILQGRQQQLRQALLTSTEGDRFLTFLNNSATFQTLEQDYKRAEFWYCTIQISLQGLFLLPLIGLSTLVHRYSQNRGYGLIALISWHLTVIFYLPLVVKLFQFLQVGALFEVLSRLVRMVLGELLFLVSYLYILIIPLIGFGVIKFCQKVVFNPKLQAAGYLQKGLCLRCAKKIRHDDTHCPHCGYYQLVKCNHCQQSTYKYLPHCRACGASQSPQLRVSRRLP